MIPAWAAAAAWTIIGVDVLILLEIWQRSKQKTIILGRRNNDGGKDSSTSR